MNYLVCLVIDEAHRAMGNYSYCVAVRELKSVPVELRILALTATPGSKQQTIQRVIDNLHISVLEYRNESEPDVSPYVHDRKIELIQVAMGQDAVEINKLLLEVIRPLVAKLGTIGVLQSRDFQTLSPCELLKLRENFRLAPPPALHNMKCGEVEGYFGVLITLYYIRKILSSHGIKYAYEMLEEKLKQGSLRSMCRNEGLWNAKLLMEKSLSHGAPSPKLSKMLEVLIDHFKTNDPRNSRVIIFSNYRGSVRDIMVELARIEDLVKATQFIGQSSGKKSLKGQSQKAQQAVLEQFRAGGYNVIVATSIGEEGLDIMEVDLVICFDANVSPLRMIQRMGRTGRKHDGRVVVLACEGPELKGYMRKQANSKSLRKHMRNGGMNSFNFHSSPRMVPHIYKPEIQFVKLSVEQYIPRGRKTKDDSIRTPTFTEKLTHAENDLIAKYFASSRENTWRPSLIAFPHFNAFPSSIHKVKHSLRSSMLIDAMQNLQELSFSREIKAFPFEASSDLFLGAENVEHDDSRKDSLISVDCSKALSQREEHAAVLPRLTSRRKEECTFIGFGGQKNNQGDEHSFLFGLDYVSVDSRGRVIITSVPFLPLKEYNEELHVKEKHPHRIEKICQSPNVRDDFSSEVGIAAETPDVTGLKMMVSEYRDTELSPRLSNFMERGVVPESPIDETGLLNSEKNTNSNADGAATSIIKDNVTQTPVLSVKISSTCNFTSPFVQEIKTPTENLTKSSTSKDWCMSSGEKSDCGEKVTKFRRLRKYGESPKKRRSGSMKETRNNLSKRKKAVDGARAFIEDEAEVSLEVKVSDDEEDDNMDKYSYEDSFIDDRLDPTASVTQPESNRTDMMAIYRRSLLSQSPLERLPECPTNCSPNSMASITKSSETESSSGKTTFFLQTPQNERILSEVVPCSTIRAIAEAESRIERSRKRKLMFYQVKSLPAVNLEQEFFHMDVQNHCEVEATGDVFNDDEFYEGLDLDAMEAQATMLLQSKSDLSVKKTDTVSGKTMPVLDLSGSPSFNLGT